MPTSLHCPGLDSWHALFGGQVPGHEQEDYERHLESCPRCQDRLDHDEEDEDLLRRLGQRFGDPSGEPVDALLTQVLKRLEEVKSSDRVPPLGPADLYFLRPASRPGLLGMLGDYEIIDVIGQGGMGVVLEASDPALHRIVAIKVMAAAVAGSAVARQRFKREAQAAAAVCHDHIVTVHGIHEVDGLPCLVMQYVPGESLQARLDHSGPLEVAEIVRIGFQTASGLAAAHAQGLIHRDIKPANLLLEDGLSRVKITDFGLARMADETPLTQNGVVTGTPEYMAPEQARGETIDHRADLFSLGSVLYAMCTGLPPFRGSSAIAVLRQVSDQTPRPIRALNPEIPAWLESLVGRLMAKSPAERFQSAAEVAALLEGYLAHLREPMTIDPPDLPLVPGSELLPTPAPRRRAVVGLGILALVLLVGVGAAWWFVAAEAEANPPSTEQVLSQRFEGATELDPGLRFVGIQPENHVKFEPEGLRITLLPGSFGQRPMTGVASTFGLKGDFEITVGFEILAEERGSENPNQFTGLSLEVIPQRPGDLDSESWIKSSQNRAGLMRTLMGRNRTAFLSLMTQWEGAGDHPREEVVKRPFPTTAKSGRLRLARTGAAISHLVAEESSEEFNPLNKDPFGSMDVNHFRVVASTAGVTGAITVRLKDLHVKAAAFTRVPARIPKRSWWKPIAIVLSLFLALNLGVLVYFVRRKRRKGTGVVAPVPAPRPVEGATLEPSVPPATVAFACPSCGKSLRTRADLAGKKVKCRHCAAVVQVPEKTAGEEDDSRSEAIRPRPRPES